MQARRVTQELADLMWSRLAWAEDQGRYVAVSYLDGSSVAALLCEIAVLREAIKQHRDRLDTEDGLQDEGDRKLWEVLDA